MQDNSSDWFQEVSKDRSVGLLFVRGDYNPDGQIKMNDALTLLLWLFGQPGAAATLHEDAVDWNDDGSFVVNHALTSLLYLFNTVR